MAPHRSVHAFTARFFPHSSVSLRWVVAAFALLAALCWASPAWAVDSAVFASGAGTEADPYLIENASQLAAFRDAVNAADVDLEGAEWTPIGAGTRKSSGIAEGSTPFAGTFDGAGHTVSGLKITSTQGADYAIGLFGILDGATAKNLTVADTKIAVPQSELAGILCGMLANDSTVSGVSVSGSVSGKAGVGGIAGRMTLSGTIENCENSASVTAAGGVGNAGGIVGAAYYTTPTGRMAITGCRNSGSISGTDCIGGIAGLSATFVSNCENSGAIAGTSYSVGGIVGEQKNYGAVSGCTNSGAVSTSNASAYGIGGIVGWARYDGAAPAYAASAPITVTGCANSASVQGGSCAGGIVGTTPKATTSANFANDLTGNVNIGVVESGVTRYIGGISGGLGTDGTIENNFYDASLNPMGAIESSPAPGMTGLGTRQLTSGTLPTGLETSLWSAAADSYLIPAKHADEAALQAVRHQYILFADGEDRTHVSANATLATFTGLSWELLSHNGFTVSGNTLLPPASAQSVVVDTLQATLGGYKRLVPVQFIPKAPWAGEGTAASPWLVTDAQLWNAIGTLMAQTGDEYEGKYFRVANDIDFAGAPIGMIAVDPVWRPTPIPAPSSPTVSTAARSAPPHLPATSAALRPTARRASPTSAAAMKAPSPPPAPPATSAASLPTPTSRASTPATTAPTSTCPRYRTSAASSAAPTAQRRHSRCTTSQAATTPATSPARPIWAASPPIA